VQNVIIMNIFEDSNNVPFIPHKQKHTRDLSEDHKEIMVQIKLAIKHGLVSCSKR